MQVSFYATLRQMIGQKTIEVPVEPGATVSLLLDALLELYPDMRAELFDEDGELYGHVHVFINGNDAPYLDDGWRPC